MACARRCPCPCLAPGHCQHTRHTWRPCRHPRRLEPRRGTMHLSPVRVCKCHRLGPGACPQQQASPRRLSGRGQRDVFARERPVRAALLWDSAVVTTTACVQKKCSLFGASDEAGHARVRFLLLSSLGFFPPRTRGFSLFASCRWCPAPQMMASGRSETMQGSSQNCANGSGDLFLIRLEILSWFCSVAVITGHS